MLGLQKYRHPVLFFLLAVVYVYGLFIDVMNIDAAQYASISQELFQNNSWLQIKHGNENYLDKPPLLFWLAALSFKIFGISNWAFKLPTFLFTCLGMYATYRLALLYYTKTIAIHATLMLASCQAFFLFNNDVRTDALLTACVVIAAWQLAAYLQNNNWRFFMGACVFAALGMLAKGPIALMILIWTFGVQLLLNKEWQKIFHWKWLLGILIILIILLPMSYGLYWQHGWKGVKFFYWTQSFGRITGESEWNNGAGYLFFTHTFLWAFLPWSLVAIAALFSLVKQFLLRKKLVEYVSLAGFAITFAALSLSKYKLPHYIFVTFPFAAIFSAQFLHSHAKQIKWFKIIHTILLPISVAAIFVVSFYIFPTAPTFALCLSLLCCVVAFFLYFSSSLENFIASLVLIFIAVNFISNAHFYPQLMQHQVGKKATIYMKEHTSPGTTLVCFEKKNHDLDFYYGKVVPFFNDADLKNYQGWVYSEADVINRLKELQIPIKKTVTFNHYNVQHLSWHFLNPKTRKETLKRVYLVEI